MSSDPKVTVLMCAYNEASYITEAIESILRQSFTDFEFIIIDDASTDQTVETIRTMPDRRIRLVENDTNLGLTQSLNKGLLLAKGTYIARMDADDIALPHRLAAQVAYMEQHPETILCGSWAALFGKQEGVRKHPSESNLLKVRLLFSCQFIHPSVMLRKSALVTYQLYYNETFRQAQDYELWVRMIPYGQFHTIPEELIKYRVHAKQISHQDKGFQKENTHRIYRFLLEKLGVPLTSEHIELHQHLAYFEWKQPFEILLQAQVYFEQLIEANEKCGYFPRAAFKKFLQEYWWQLCANSTAHGLRVYRLYFTAALAEKRSWVQQSKFLLKAMLKYSR